MVKRHCNRKNKLNKKINVKEIFEVVLRQCVFIILNIYAISKILGGQFYMKGKLPAEVANTTLGEASSFSLAWTFMVSNVNYLFRKTQNSIKKKNSNSFDYNNFYNSNFFF